MSGCSMCPIKKKKTLPDGRIILEIGNEEWGPRFWKILHTMAERVGNSPSPMIIRDQSIDFFCVMNYLGKVIPCKICQAHYHDYLMKNKLTWGKLFIEGKELKNHIRIWIFNLHNHIRKQKQQEIVFSTIQECVDTYKDLLITEEEIDYVIHTISHGVRLGIVKYDEAKKWTTCFRRLLASIR